MRRALIMLLLAVPALAQAQTPAAGSILADSNTINLRQCLQTPSGTGVPPLTNELNVGLTWTVDLDDNTFRTGGRFRLYASTAQTKGDDDEGRSCMQPLSGSGPTSTFIGEYTETDASSASMLFEKAVPMDDLAALFGASACTASGDVTIYLCVAWVPPNGADTAEEGWATGTIRLDRTPPVAPGSFQIQPGDGRLRITGCTGTGAAEDDFLAAATPVGGGTPKYSSRGEDCDVRITGLTNRTDYSVVVYRIDGANNPSAASAALTGTPIPSDDLWEHYDGEEQGGCNTGAGAAGILGALSLIAAAAAARRRKS
jgi:uncharacterized protein (TIGR03382 family)